MGGFEEILAGLVGGEAGAFVGIERSRETF